MIYLWAKLYPEREKKGQKETPLPKEWGSCALGGRATGTNSRYIALWVIGVMYTLRIRGAGSRLVILLYVPEPNEGHVHVATMEWLCIYILLFPALTSFAGERFWFKGLMQFTPLTPYTYKYTTPCGICQALEFRYLHSTTNLRLYPVSHSTCRFLNPARERR